MNDLTKPAASGVGALAALRNNLQGVRARMPTRVSSPYLRILKDGGWVFGQEDHPLKTGTEAVINTLSIQHGYSCWSNNDKDPKAKNENLGEILVPVAQNRPERHELENLGFPWNDLYAFDVKVLDGTYKGQEVMHKATSKGGVGAVQGIIDAILARLDEGSDYICPVVTLGSDSYRHKSYGKTYFPVFEIVSWMNIEGQEDPAYQPDDGDEPAPAVTQDTVERHVLPPKTPVAAPAKPEKRDVVEPEVQPAFVRRVAAAPVEAEVVEEPEAGEPIRRRRRS